MKKSIVITIGVVLILIVLGVWGYLLFFGTPGDSDEIFTNLGIGPSSGTVADTGDTTEFAATDESLINIAGAALQQLTTRPVAGFAFTGSSTNHVRYVERGTGHVYEIDLESGSETRVSATTIPRVVNAVFSETGNSIALVIENDTSTSVNAGVVSTAGSLERMIELTSGAFDPYFISDNVLRYSVETGNGVRGEQLDIRENTPTTLFTMPLRSVHMLWLGTDIYLFNKTAAALEGSLYEIVDGYPKPVSEAAFGFSAGVNDSYTFVTHSSGNTYTSFATNKLSGTSNELAVLFVPEKCTTAVLDDSFLWCAASFDTQPTDFMENWYKGVVTSEDFLWLVDIEREQAQLEMDFLRTSGRIMDVDGIKAGTAGVLLRNKVDDTLWLYDPTIQ